MPILHVRNVPKRTYARLRREATSRQKSLSAEVVDLLEHALREREECAEHGRVLCRIRRRRFVPPPATPSSLDLLREDRAR
jgi:plasmid stability protein